jgi:hypothetical protein
MSLNAMLRLRPHSLPVSCKDDAGTLCRLGDHRHSLNIGLLKADCRASIIKPAFGPERLRFALVTMEISHDVSTALMLESDRPFLSHSLPPSFNLSRCALRGMAQSWQMRHGLLCQGL